MTAIWGEKEKPKRKPPSKSEWETLKKIWGNKCVLCQKTEKAVGTLIKAHVKAFSAGGTQYFPMCANCHGKFDKGQLTPAQLQKLGLTDKEYQRLRPKTRSKGKPTSTGIAFRAAEELDKRFGL